MRSEKNLQTLFMKFYVWKRNVIYLEKYREIISCRRARLLLLFAEVPLKPSGVA
jgi:hypothetical protein